MTDDAEKAGEATPSFGPMAIDPEELGAWDWYAGMAFQGYVAICAQASLEAPTAEGLATFKELREGAAFHAAKHADLMMAERAKRIRRKP